jgi:transposase
MPTIEIIRQNLSISQLRAEAARTGDAKQTRRILAIAMVLDGHSRRLAAQAVGMDRQTPRDWVIRSDAWLGGARGPAPAWASASSGRSPAERSGEVGRRRP